MSRVLRLDVGAAAAPRLTLFGTGTVGSAFVARYQRLRTQGLELPSLAWLANSRGVHDCRGGGIDAALEQARAAPRARGASPSSAEPTPLRAGDFVIDATASDAVADRHAGWLQDGVHVVTANKLGSGGELVRAQAIIRAAHDSGARYGDSATVGAGLPLLRSLRALLRGGERIHRIEGVMSGSLAWLLSGFDGTQAFSQRLRQARDAGYTEPDPRQDLSGEDVRRKLLILARAASFALESHEVRVDSLLPPLLRTAPDGEAEARWPLLDEMLAQRLRQAEWDDCRLCFVGNFAPESGAEVGLRALPRSHPLCAGSGTDNRVAIWCDRYPNQPLLIQGPGAGAEVTAAALLDDVLESLTADRS
ncbi:homoserine dehydrogenase [Pseudoxanthomonas kalamensis DSM 18571]|uniref:homoserine dehydrogenase n=1 Tax=Pseudoxanthomonas kalamensis TaxID=289483 RepID=UPI001391F528|nr:homoserine dehydrogenase [Pseudoxanthomonas kalamensis]KAF1711271.1 homoserine dehydrogenase [Pseudoxanthomonas kalamensis DSM 18571]